MRARGARQQLLVFVALLLCSSNVTFQATRALLPQFQLCTRRRNAHASIIAAGLLLPNATVPDSIHIAQRRAASKFLQETSTYRTCEPVRVSKRVRQRLEYSLYSPCFVDGTLLYLMALIGFRSHLVVEVDDSPTPSLLSAALALHRNCRVIALYESWAGYELSHKFYEPVAADYTRDPEIRPVVLESRFTGKEGLLAILRREGVGGTIDVLSLLSGSSELKILRSLRQSNASRPRLVIASYQDFWGPHVHASRSDAKGSNNDVSFLKGSQVRFDIGMSIATLNSVAKASGFRLIWCTAAAPLAFFVDERNQVGDRVFTTISPKRCISERDTGLAWRRDMEALWDLAEQYEWGRLT